jgi:hypothetical protein
MRSWGSKRPVPDRRHRDKSAQREAKLTIQYDCRRPEPISLAGHSCERTIEYHGYAAPSAGTELSPSRFMGAVRAKNCRGVLTMRPALRKMRIAIQSGLRPLRDNLFSQPLKFFTCDMIGRVRS